MLTIETGKPYPDPRYRDHEGLVIVPTETSFFLLAIIPSLKPKEIAAWKSGTLRYGMFLSASGVPFILLDFPSIKMTLDASFNAAKLSSQHAATWLAADPGNLVHIVLVSAEDYVVRAQRAIGVQAEVPALLKDAALSHRTTGATATEIDERIRRIMSTFSTADMIQSGKMYSL